MTFQSQFLTMLERLRAIQMRDAQYKSTSACLLSLLEELGEFAREVKIEEQHFGNAHKESGPDGSIGEAVDLVIMALAMYYMRHACQYGRHPLIASEELVDRINLKLDKWARNQELKFEGNHGKAEEKAH